MSAVYFPANPTQSPNAVSAAIAYATTNKAESRFKLTLVNRNGTPVVGRYIAHSDNWIMCQLENGQLSFIASESIASVIVPVLPDEY